jgi:hypothetical protein
VAVIFGRSVFIHALFLGGAKALKKAGGINTSDSKIGGWQTNYFRQTLVTSCEGVHRYLVPVCIQELRSELIEEYKNARRARARKKT